MVRLASRTTMLVAASIPAEPAASRNWRSSVLFSRANLSAMATTPSRVSALWSLRKAITGISEQSVLNSSGAFTEACWAA
ncbi:hypothetical protein D3C85_1489880 [compost metagenome]